MNSIEVNGIIKMFGEKKILDNISFSVSEGEIFGLLGPSGAGKTTLIKILTGQMKSTDGNARILQEECNHLDASAYRQIGMVLDHSGLYERLTCYDNLKLFARMYGVESKEIYTVLEAVGLKDSAKATVSKLSKGMWQRLVLARAIMHKPRLLFLDEPTSGLDPATSKSIHELLAKLKEEGITIFMTTHNMEEASKLCSHIALLNAGEIVEYGVPEELCRKYNRENVITIRCKDGQVITVDNVEESGERIKNYFEANAVETIHSSEPNLEMVFMALTGRSLSI